MVVLSLNKTIVRFYQFHHAKQFRNAVENIYYENKRCSF